MFTNRFASAAVLGALLLGCEGPPGSAPDGVALPAPTDDVVVVGRTSTTIDIVVTHNDGVLADSTLKVTDAGDLMAEAIDADTLRVELPDAPGEYTLEYVRRLGDDVTAPAMVTVFVDSFFDAQLDRMTAGDEGARILDAFDDDQVAPWQPNLVLRIDHGGETVLERSYGDLTPTSPVPLASATKLLAATLVLNAVHRGDVDLDDRFSDHLPDFSSPALDGEGEQRGDITLRQAFAMTSGLYSNHRYHTMRALTHDQSVEAIRHSDVEGNGWTSGPVPMAYVPGTRVGYDGKGMQVAGRAVLAAMGDQVDWFEHADEALVVPCGLQDTSFDQYAPNPAVAGGGISSSRDYMTVLRMLAGDGTCDGERIVPEDAEDILYDFHTTPEQGSAARLPIFGSPWPNCSDVSYVFGPVPPLDCSTWLDGTPTGGSFYERGLDTPRYAFGAWALGVDSADRIDLIGSPGAHGTHPWIDRNRGLQGIFLTQVSYLADEGNDRAVWTAELDLLQTLRARWDEVADELAPWSTVE